MPRLYTQGSRSDEVSLIPLVRPAIRRKVMLIYRRQLRDEHPSAITLGNQLMTVLRTKTSPPALELAHE